MNAHDSERIRGLLEELGLGEAPTPAEADVLVFNTCTIREKPDQRLAAYLGDARMLKVRNPDAVIAVGGCYAEAQRDRIFERYPFVDVAFGPGTIHHLGDWLGAGGLGVARSAFGTADERRFSAELATQRERPFQAWVQISMGCNSVCSYCIVPAVRGREVSRRPGEILAEIARARRRRRPRDHAAGPERQLVGARSPARRSHRVRRAAARRGRRRRHRAHSLHEPAPEGLPGSRDRRHGRVRRRLRARAPSAAVGLDTRAQAHAAHLQPRALPPPRGRASCRHPRPLRSPPTSSSASPARRTATSTTPAALVEEVGFDGAFTFVYSPRSGTEAAAMPDQVPDDAEARAHRATRRGRPARRGRAKRPARGPRRGGARRGQRAAPTSRCSAGALVATRPSTSPDRRTPASWCRSVSRRPRRRRSRAARKRSSQRRCAQARQLTWDGCVNVRDLGGHADRGRRGDERTAPSCAPTTSARSPTRAGGSCSPTA